MRLEVSQELEDAGVEEVSQVIHEEAARRLKVSSDPPSVSPTARGVAHVLQTLPQGPGRVVALCVLIVVVGVLIVVLGPAGVRLFK